MKIIYNAALLVNLFMSEAAFYFYEESDFFDVMGVIFEVGDDTNDLLVPYIQKIDSEISKEKINEVYIKASLGKISSRQFWCELGFVNGYE